MHPSYSVATFTPLYAQAPVFMPSNAACTRVTNLQPNSYPVQTEPQLVPCSPPSFPSSTSPSTRGPARFYAPPPQPMSGFRMNGNSTSTGSLHSPQMQLEPKPTLLPYRELGGQPLTQRNSNQQLQLQPHPQTGPRLPQQQQNQNSTGIFYPHGALQQHQIHSSNNKQLRLDKSAKSTQVNNTRSTSFRENSENQQTIYQRPTALNTAASYHSAVDGCVLPLTEPERHQLFGQFEEVLATHGTMEVFDNRLLSIFMQLPTHIRRGIKRLGGIKPFLQEAEERFIVEGENVSLRRDPTESSTKETSFDAAEWEESRTEDFFLMPPDENELTELPVESSEDTTQDDPESAKLLEMCSFFSGFGSGGGYYDDYVALYPGKKPSFITEDKFGESIKRKPHTSDKDASGSFDLDQSELMVHSSRALHTQQSHPSEQDCDLAGPEEFFLNKSLAATTMGSKSLTETQRVEDDQEGHQENWTLTEAFATEMINQPKADLADAETSNSSNQQVTGSSSTESTLNLLDVLDCCPSFGHLETHLSTTADKLTENDPKTTQPDESQVHVMEELVPCSNSIRDIMLDTIDEIAQLIGTQPFAKDKALEIQGNGESESVPKYATTEAETESHNFQTIDSDLVAAVKEANVTADNEYLPSAENSSLPQDKDVDRLSGCDPVVDNECKETLESTCTERTVERERDNTMVPNNISTSKGKNGILKSIEEGEYELDGSLSSHSSIGEDKWKEGSNEEECHDCTFPDLNASQNGETKDQPQMEKPISEVLSNLIPFELIPSKSKLENAKEKLTDLEVKDAVFNKAPVKTKDKGISTDAIKTCTRAICTKKIVQKNQCVNTDDVVTRDQAVETQCDLEEACIEKYKKAMENVRTLEISLDCERNMMVSFKNKHFVELRELKEALQESKQCQWDAERELEVRRKQQTSELKKTTIELKELQGHYGMVKSRLSAAEKQNSCLSSELQSVARELLDLEASSAIAQAIDKVIAKTDAETDTQELDKAREYSDRVTADRIVALSERAKSAELKVLEMQHRSLRQEINHAATDAEYSYNIYAQSPGLSLPERVQLVSKWSEYQSNVQAVISKLESEYTNLMKMIKDQDKTLAQLPIWTKPSLEAFTLTSPRHLTSNFSDQQEVFRFSARPTCISKTNQTVSSTDGTVEIPVVSSIVVSTQSRPPRGRGRGRRLANTVTGDPRLGEVSVGVSKSDQLYLSTGPSSTAVPSTSISDPLPQEHQGIWNHSQTVVKEPANLPETAVPQEEAMPPGLRYGSRLPSAGGDGVESCGSFNKQDTPAAEQTTKQTTAKSRAERIQRIQRRLNSAAALSKLRSTFSEGHQHPNALGTQGHSARRLNLLKALNSSQQSAAPESVGISSTEMPQSQAMSERHPGVDICPEGRLHSVSLGHSQEPVSATLPDDVNSRPDLTPVVKQEPSQMKCPAASALPTFPEVMRQNMSNQSVIQPVYQQIENIVGDQMLHRAGQRQVRKLPTWQPGHPPPLSQCPPLYSLPLMSLRLNTPQAIPARFNPSNMIPQRMPIFNPAGGQLQSVPPPVQQQFKPPPNPVRATTRITEQQQEQPQPHQKLKQEQQDQKKQPDPNQPNLKEELLSNETVTGLTQDLSEPLKALSEKSVNPVDSECRPVSCANEDQPDTNEAMKDDPPSSSSPLKSAFNNPTGGVVTKLFCENTRQDPITPDVLCSVSCNNLEGTGNPRDNTNNLSNLTPAQKISMEWKAKTLKSQSVGRSEDLETSTRDGKSSNMPSKTSLPAEFSHCDPISSKGKDFPFQEKSSSAWHNPLTLPPRFQTSHRVQQSSNMCPESHYTDLPDPLPIESVSAEEQHLKKRKAGDQDCQNRHNEIQIPLEKTEEVVLDADEWQTQMSKRKKKALAQQGVDIKKQQQTKAKKAGSMDKLIGVLSQQFTNVKPKEVMEVIKQVRLDHNGSLSGIPISTIIEEARLYIKTKLEAPAAAAKSLESTAQAGGRELPTLQAIQQIVPEQENSDLCVICQEDMDSQTGDVRMLDCGHLFHDECICIWYNTRERTCPICRCHTLFAEDFPRLQ